MENGRSSENMNKNSLQGDSAGQDFVKKLRPAGAALFLILFAVVTLFLFTSGRDPISGYEAPHDAAYYAASAQTMEELCEELRENVLPRLDGPASCRYDSGTNTVVVSIDDSRYAVVRSAVLRYFDASLFTFEKN